MTTSDQLLNKLKYFKTFIGVFPRDLLPVIKYLPVCLIINTDPHYKPGEHWVSVFINQYGVGIYFDSYGLRPLNKEIEIFLNKNCKSWTYNHVQLQGYRSYTCGEFCVIFSFLKILGYSLWDIIGLFTEEYKTNDKIVEKIYENL
jgi:hypothetical protein